MVIEFYDELYAMLTKEKFGYTFKIARSMTGKLYPSWSTLARTVSWQPSLLTLLSYGPIKYNSANAYELGDFIGTYFFHKTQEIPLNQREDTREILVHNLINLSKSYDAGRFDETTCIRAIAKANMTNVEYVHVVTGK